jgi:hypothetical protein
MSKKSKKIEVQGSEITVIATNEQDYISLTDSIKPLCPVLMRGVVEEMEKY